MQQTTDLCDLSAVALRQLIGERRISPVELLSSCRRRIEEVNPRVNALPTLDFTAAEQAAKLAERQVMAGDELGVLHGLPAAIKDLNATGGLRSTFGSRVYAEHVPTSDDAIAAAIRAAGAVIVGKSNTPEFGAGANTTNLVFGATHNPYAHGLTAGGSSGGAAAALATGMVPIANGSDRGGSLRIPAAFCGVVGFRPSPGMVPFAPRAMGWIPLCVEGPMGRTVADTRLLFSVLCGTRDFDPLTVRAQPVRKGRPLARLRVAISEDLGFAPIDDIVRVGFRDVVQCIRHLFGECSERTIDLRDADETFEVLRALDFVASHSEHYARHRDLLGDNVIRNFEQGQTMSLGQVASAIVSQTAITHNSAAFFADVDLLVCPTVSVLPFPLETNHPQAVGARPTRTYFDWFALTYALTLTTLPVISIPCGMLGGTTFGIQLAAAPRADLDLLEWAEALETEIRSMPALLTPPPPISRAD
jgi:Asp-tRNA(Asn)/Glu-tRNA(Gln) amidotransferase A subunit family amidase